MTTSSPGTPGPYAPGGIDAKPQVESAAFAALDLRVGVVVAAEPFPQARRPAYKLTVDFGPVLGRRRTSAQVTNYLLDDLVGRHVVGAVNLPLRRIAGFDSEFLVLGGLEEDGTVALLQPDRSLPPGAVVA